ncbi:MAG: NUDIX hydrolase [Opitutae bacterium]|nr:NUDIX hydrolase [Opitutae bacterium]
MQPWKTLHREVLLRHSKYLTVENHTVGLPDGSVISDWNWIVSPDFINVVAVTEDARYLCFRQVKYGIEGDTLAVVGGYLEPGEEPLVAAQRELLEETGHTAPDWSSLGTYRVDTNHGAGLAHFFLARGAQRVTEPNSDDLEEQELLQLTRAEAQAALLAGQFRGLSWATILAMALLRS